MCVLLDDLSTYFDLKGDILGLGKVWQMLYVCGIDLFSYLNMYVHFWKKYAGW